MQVSHAKENLFTLIHSSGKRLHDPEGTWLDTLCRKCLLIVPPSTNHASCLPILGNLLSHLLGFSWGSRMEEGTRASGNQQPITSSSYSNAGGGNPYRKSELKVNKVPWLELLLEGGILFPSSSPPTWNEGKLWLGSHSVPGVGEGPFWDRIHTEEVELEVELVPGEDSEDIGTR